MRPTIEKTMLDIAEALALRSTCLKAKVGCVLTDFKGRIIGSGYNGVARGRAHCNETVEKPVYHDDTRVTRKGDYFYFSRQGPDKAPFESWFKETGNRQCVGFEDSHPHACAGHDLPPGSETCQAVHAEINALIQCREPDAINSVYCTAEPCFRCAKELLNTGAKRIIFRRPYGPEPQAGALWLAAGREWRQEKG